jgi:hypothetical protein
MALAGLLMGVCSFTDAAERDVRVPAFPGAEGFGAYTPGGRGGTVLLVTNLNDSGPGSLRAACEAEGPRIVVIRVGGIIELKSSLAIHNPFITIAGQSAPGVGVCLKDYPLNIRTHDVVVRYLRCRPGDSARKEMDSLSVFGERVIADHCSASWGMDETLSVTHSRDVTVQWCMITESLNRSYHHKGPHGFGSLIAGEDGGITFHHNIYAHHVTRNPRPGGYAGRPGPIVDFRNNLIYDWVAFCGYTGRERVRINYVGNYLKPGPSAAPHEGSFAFYPGGLLTTLFAAGNVLEGFPGKTRDNWLMIQPLEPYNRSALRFMRAAQPFPVAPVRTDSAQVAYRRILDQCGAALPMRDAVDARIVEEIRTGAGKIIDSQGEVGGWPEYKSAEPPTDSDLDGMPDAWENAHGLNANDPSDASVPGKDGSGYTNVEEYLNSLCPAIY